MAAEKAPLTKLATKSSSSKQDQPPGQVQEPRFQRSDRRCRSAEPRQAQRHQGDCGEHECAERDGQEQSLALPTIRLMCCGLAKSQQIVSQAGNFTSASQVLVAKDEQTEATAQITINFGTVSGGTPALTRGCRASASRRATTGIFRCRMWPMQSTMAIMGEGLISDKTGSVRSHADR